MRPETPLQAVATERWAVPLPAADASPRAAPAVEPFGIDPACVRSVWTMPSFYLVPFMCAYLFGAMWTLRGLSALGAFAARSLAPPRRGARARHCRMVMLPARSDLLRRR